MTIRYYERDGHEVPLTAVLGLMADNTVRKTTLAGDVEVSTIHLVLNHRFGGGPPLIFETHVFGGPLNGDGGRWSTETEAIDGHEEWVRRAHEAAAGETP